MSVAVITPEIKTQIAEMVERARAHPVPWSTLKDAAISDPGPTLTLAERKGGRVRPPSEHMIIPNGFHIAFSFEEQPAGIFRHLSVSLHDGTLVPNPQAVIMIAMEFGIDLKAGVGRTWLEEFAPGRYAVNLVQLEMQHEAGHA